MQHETNKPQNDMAGCLLVGGGLYYIQSAFPLQLLLPKEFQGYALLAIYGIYIIAVIGILRIFGRQTVTYLKFVKSKKPSVAYGSAGFITKQEAEKAGMYRRGPHFIGVLHGKIAWTDPPAHILILAPARAGKSTSGILPQLGLNNRSAIVSDLKGELFEQTARYREKKFGHKIVELNLSKRVSKNPASYNVLQIVLDSLANEPERAVEDAWSIAQQLYPEPPGGSKDPYWPYGSKGVLACSILGLAILDPDKCNLVEVRNIVTDTHVFVALCEILAESDALGGDPVKLAQSFVSMAQRTPKELQSFNNGAAQAVSVYTESGRIGAISRSCTFRFRDTKRQPMTIYIGADDTNPDEINKVLGLLNWAAALEIIREGNAKPVFIYADEAARYRIANLPDTLEGSTGFGLRFVLVYQSFASMVAIYGQEGSQRIIGLCTTAQIFGLNDHNEAYRVSQALGQLTERVSSYGVTGELSENVSLHGRNLMTADEIRRMDKDHMLVLTSGERPAVMTKISSHRIYPLAYGFAPNRLYSNRKRLGKMQVLIFPRFMGRFMSGVAQVSGEYKIKRPGWPWGQLIGKFLLLYLIGPFKGSKPMAMITLVLFICVVTAGLPYIRYDMNAGACSYAGFGVMHRSQPDCPMVLFEPLPNDTKWIYEAKRSVERFWY